MNYEIYWKQFGRTAYLSGTHLSTVGKSVKMRNILIPPGTVMYAWKSAMNYQASRSQANLPLLTKGERYRMRIRAEMTPNNSIYLRLNFYDRFQKSLSFVILKPGEEEFIYPVDAYYYDIELVNAGCTQLCFDCLELATSPCQTKPDEVKQVTVLFLEKGDEATLRGSTEAKKAGNLVLSQGADSLYFDQSCLQAVEDMVDRYPNVPIFFVGKGPVGNFAALYYAMYVERSLAYVTYDMHSKAWYDQKMSVIFNQKVDVDRFLSRLSYDQQVIWYKPLADRRNLSFVAPAMNELDYLLTIPTNE